MDIKTKLLIAVGAAVVANCQPCLKTLLKKTKDAGITEKEIIEASGVARVVRKNAQTQIDKFLAGITGAGDTGENAADGCGCSL
jgi:AhpD family alkylhydroperoxidase